MKHIADLLSWLILIICWVVGIVLAKGFWSTLFSIILPPWGWYLIAEYVMKTFVLINGN